MIRYALIGLAALATAATSAASVQSIPAPQPGGANMTVIDKNQDFPLVGPITVEKCAVEDCSDNPS